MHWQREEIMEMHSKHIRKIWKKKEEEEENLEGL